MKTAVTLLTCVALAWHVIAGCCVHHAHADGHSKACALHDGHAHRGHDHAGHHESDPRSEDVPAEQRPSDRELTCDQAGCTWLPTSPVEVPHDDGRGAVYLPPALRPAFAGPAAAFHADSIAQRTHHAAGTAMLMHLHRWLI